MAKTYDYIIIGAGLSGISLARSLQAKDKDVLILEKSRNIGGRFAHRRFENYSFNFGPRSFFWDELFFKDEIEFGLKQGFLELQDGEVFPSTNFNIWMKKLAQDLKVEVEEVSEVFYDQSYFLKTASGEVHSTKALISTAPAEQSYNLLHKLADLEALKEVEYERHMYYMFSLKDSHFTHENLKILNKHELNDLFYYDCLIVADWTEVSRSELKAYYDITTKPVESFAHKWRYANCTQGLDFFYPDSPNLYLVGDYFYNLNLAGSYESLKKVMEKI